MLNLEAKTKPQELILAYLKNNASKILVEKINNGVQIEKDGVQLISKKTLDSFMKYACDEARKLAEKGANAACIERTTVYGWAIHYFEEDSIEGKLYNLDGTEYKPQKTVNSKPIPTQAVKKEPTKTQFSFFDMIPAEEQTPENPTEEKPAFNEILNIDDDYEAEENMSAETQKATTPIEVKPAQPKPKISPVYEQYLELKKQNPSAVILMRLGDFYEAFESDAKQLADEMNLTLTGRDFGLGERVPIVGFPYHASDMYFQKISEFHDVVVFDEGKTRRIKSRKLIDRETGEITASETEMENPYPSSTFHKDTMIVLFELLDGKMNLQ